MRPVAVTKGVCLGWSREAGQRTAIVDAVVDSIRRAVADGWSGPG